MYLTQVMVGAEELAPGEWSKLMMNMNYGVTRTGTVLKTALLQRLYSMPQRRELSIHYGTFHAGYSPKKLKKQLTENLRNFEATAIRIVGNIQLRGHRCTRCKMARGIFGQYVTLPSIPGCANCCYLRLSLTCGLAEK